MKYLFISCILILILFIIISSCLKYRNYEHYCKVPKTNRQGVDNNFDIFLPYKPQSNINNSNCDKYWKKFANEYNSSFDLEEPLPISSDQLKLPPTSAFGDRNYTFGLLDFKLMENEINDKNLNIKLFNNADKLIIDPIDKKNLSYEYQVEFFILQMNKKTFKKRFEDYNPVKQNYFETFKSPIPEINILNKEFLKRMNEKQGIMVSRKDKLQYGLKEYQIYCYRIIDIKYLNNNKNNPIFSVQVNLFQDYNYYIPSYAYIGFIDLKENKPKLFETEFIGVNQTSSFLNAPGVDKERDTDFFILNKNFNDFQPRIRDINEVNKIIDQKKELDELSSNYACFNIDVDAPQYLLDYDTKGLCEAPLDQFGRNKSVGIYDKPCKRNDECPFYQANKNYKNEFGGCVNGKCQLPSNMKNVGYNYFSPNKNYNPLCYNCNLKDKKFNIISSNVGDCCQDQYDKTKYPNLKSPDFAFENDVIPRINSYNQNNYKEKSLI